MERESQYQLEPELLLVVLLSLVQNGNITLSIAGKKFDAANLAEAGKTSLEQLLAFKHVEKPKGLPLAELVALFDLLGLAEGLIRNPDTHEEAVKQLRSKANELTEKVVTVVQHVQTGLPCWGSELIPAEDRDQQRQKLDDLKGFLEGLQAFNTPGKLKNFTRSVTEVQAQAAHLDLVKQIEDLNGLVQELTPLTGYLATAAAVLPPQDPWRTQMDTVRSEWRAKLMDPTARSAADFRQKINRALQKMKDDYKTAYFNLHKKARLGVNEDGQEEGTAQRPTARMPEETGAGRVAPAAFQPDRPPDPLGEAPAVLHAGQGRPGRLGHLPPLQLPAPGGEPRRHRHGRPPADRPAA